MTNGHPYRDSVLVRDWKIREADMADRDITTSPQRYARIGGLIYLFIIVAAAFGELFVRNRLIRWDDVVATANNIAASETLFRTGLAAEMLTCVCDVALAMILYVLLKPVSKNLALLGAFFRVTFAGVYGVTKLFEIATLVSLGHVDQLTAVSSSELQVLAYVFLRVHSLGYGASLLFFGFCCILFGHLIQRSQYLPKTIGILVAIAGYGYVTFSVAQMLSPPFAARALFPWIFPFAFVSELSLALWLLVRGVDLGKWNERVGIGAG
jgi:hypothetical protein